MSATKNIYLTGMPGAGKSTLGKKLAARMGRTFTDLDEVIERQMNMPVAAIFSQLGESQFRVAEKRALESVLNEENLVVAVGGGTPCFFENMTKMNAHGITIFLDLPADVLIQRLRSDFRERPKLANSSSLKEVILRTYEERRPFYEKSRLTITLDDPTEQDLLNALESEANR